MIKLKYPKVQANHSCTFCISGFNIHFVGIATRIALTTFYFQITASVVKHNFPTRNTAP